jgi:hypothetical protein
MGDSGYEINTSGDYGYTTAISIGIGWKIPLECRAQ